MGPEGGKTDAGKARPATSKTERRQWDPCNERGRVKVAQHAKKPFDFQGKVAWSERVSYTNGEDHRNPETSVKRKESENPT